MTTIPSPAPDYTDLDFDSLRERTTRAISQVFPQWNLDRAGMHTTLRDLLCFTSEVVVCRADNEGLESKFATLRLRRSLIAKAKFIGFSLPGAAPATCHVRFYLASAHSQDITIPASTLLATQGLSDTIYFQSLAAVTIPAGDTFSALVNIEQSQTHTFSFSSTNQPYQSYALPRTPYIDSSLSVVAGDGVYTQAADLLHSGSTDRHFIVQVDENDRATMRFGNGINGTIPQGLVTGSYKSGGGVAGNQAAAGTIAVVVPQIYDALAQPVTVTVANTTDADNGTDRMTVQEGKALVPQLATANSRCVSREDYEVNAKRLTAVGRVLMLVSDVDPSVDENSGKLYIVPTGTTAETASQVLLDAVYAYLAANYPWAATFDLQVLAAQYYEVNITARVYLRQGYTHTQVRANIVAALQALFSPNLSDGTVNEDVNFGYYELDENGDPEPAVLWGALFDTIWRATGVRKVEEDDFVPIDDITIALRQFPKLGTVTLIDGSTGVAF